MKLSYRGVCYDYTPDPILTFEPVVTVGIYRGILIPFDSRADIPEQPRVDLTWRGIPYRSGSSVKEIQPIEQATMNETIPTTSAANVETDISSPEGEMVTPKLSVLDRARNLFVQHHQKTRQREQSMLVRLNEEVGLDAEDAAHYESHIQGKIPHDFSGYDRSHTAMS